MHTGGESHDKDADGQYIQDPTHYHRCCHQPEINEHYRGGCLCPSSSYRVADYKVNKIIIYKRLIPLLANYKHLSY